MTASYKLAEGCRSGQLACVGRFPLLLPESRLQPPLHRGEHVTLCGQGAVRPACVSLQQDSGKGGTFSPLERDSLLHAPASEGSSLRGSPKKHLAPRPAAKAERSSGRLPRVLAWQGISIGDTELPAWSRDAALGPHCLRHAV